MAVSKLTIFNHKGGVGKTTLTVNIAAALGAMGKKVLLVDSDPQCNLTSYLLPDGEVDDLLDNSDNPNGETIWTAVRPVCNQIGGYSYIDPVESGMENVLLLPGDIRLSEFELFLGDAWTDCLKRRIGGLRATNAISALVNEIANEFSIDYVFYDTGPNIGPLNRVLLLDSSEFIVPVACDLFSVRALGTLGQTLKTWMIDWETIVSLAPDDTELFLGRPKFLGYIPQRFRVYGRQMAQAPSKYHAKISTKIYSDIIAELRKLDSSLAPRNASQSKLGQVKEFGTIIQEAQRKGVPLSEVHGANEKARTEAWSSFLGIAKKIKELTQPDLVKKKKSTKKRSAKNAKAKSKKASKRTKAIKRSKKK